MDLLRVYRRHTVTKNFIVEKPSNMDLACPQDFAGICIDLCIASSIALSIAITFISSVLFPKGRLL